MRRRAQLLVPAVVGATVLLIGASTTIPRGLVAIHNRATFGTFDTTGAPPRVDYCGRRYYPGSKTETRTQVEALLALNGLRGLTRIDTAPSGMPIVARVMPPQVRAQYHTNVCTMEVWVQTGPDAYRAYGLSGGP